MKMMMRIEDGERGDKYRDNSSDWMNWDSFSPYSKSVSSLNFTHTLFVTCQDVALTSIYFLEVHTNLNSYPQ